MSSTPNVPIPGKQNKIKAQFKIELKQPTDYEELYPASLLNPDLFWDQVAHEQVSWRKPWNRVSQWDYQKAKVRWYLGAELNVSENCLDRHLAEKSDHKALIWVGNQPSEERTFTFRQLYEQVCRVANALEADGVKKGDRVLFYLPNVPELAIGALACARIGAIHSVVFGGFSAHAIYDRIQDCLPTHIITADGTERGEKWIELKKNIDEALSRSCPSVRKVIVLSRGKKPFVASHPQEQEWSQWLQEVSVEHHSRSFSSEDPLFILYTSGSTGKPKGVMHSMGGYLTYASYTHRVVFQTRKDDVFWCTADMGWITGHSYLLYGPLCNGVTTVMFEGVPTYPDPGRFWQTVDQHQVNIFYSAPTAIRILAACDSKYVTSSSRDSLRTLGTVGEPINPEAWRWYHDVVGKKEMPIIDTWWQTETGGILISPIAHGAKLKPGSASFPLPGIEPKILDEKGNVQIWEKGKKVQGALVMARSWPGQMIGVYGDPSRFYDTYFSQFPGYYFTGDAAEIDEEGFFWIRGRMDDVIQVSGHRLGTAEIESACNTLEQVTEAAAVGIPDETTGEALCVFVVLREGAFVQDISLHVTKAIRTEVGGLAKPKRVYTIPGLPKTRSGKIMRRVLKKVALGETKEFGDISTLADPMIVEKIVDAVLIQKGCN